MVIVFAALFVQIVLIPFIRCLISVDFSVDTIIDRTTYEYHWVGLSVAVATYNNLSGQNILIFYAAALVISYVPIMLFQRIALTDWQQLLILQTGFGSGLLVGSITHFWPAALLANIGLSNGGVILLNRRNKDSRYDKQFKHYILSSYRKFSARYGRTVKSQNLTKSEERALYAIMITENANNPLFYRIIENAAQNLTKKTMTTGIMQVQAHHVLNDAESITLAVPIIKKSFIKKRGADPILQLGLTYNGEPEYSEMLRAIIDILKDKKVDN